jgi:hypothetical protein
MLVPLPRHKRRGVRIIFRGSMQQSAAELARHIRKAGEHFSKRECRIWRAWNGESSKRLTV